MTFRLYSGIFVLCAVFFVGPAGAAIYKYVDARGVCHYTNAPGDKRYKLADLNSSPRASAKRGTVRLSTSGKSRRTLHLMTRRSASMAPYDFDHHIRRAARAHRVDPLLIRAIIKTESNFNPLAVSSQGAQGLMQLMPGTARDLHVKDPFDAGQNIFGGTRYIRQLLNSYHGNVRLSLAAYNAGPGRVKQSVPRIPETVAYVSKVMRLYRQYRRGAGAAGTRSNAGRLVTVN
jgi:soluble lytic murein transglycosylase-like protein